MSLEDDVEDDEVAELLARKQKDLWPQGEKLQVRFLSKIPGWRKEDGNFISTDDILAVANEWHQCGGVDVVPEFVPYKEGKSDIRVQFIGMCTENIASYVHRMFTDILEDCSHSHVL